MPATSVKYISSRLYQPPSPNLPVVGGDSSPEKQLSRDTSPDTSHTVTRLLQENSLLEQEVAELQLQLKVRIVNFATCLF